ncbi:FAD-binding oxidoreductase [Rhodoplanes sp. TEM]|uniref:FAD-binding oxidoreductase n=1 Tax=Rhodoplanes tepidamans TaxID=200616 RepID=A0ABT5JFH3_RHOTP|nr:MULTISPECIES: FAD-binding oxidoreductase [Rhodoplanes]MDC7788076.1 FAD-binding oxidoreductase [Rhodoplanes tepidamans]MDC7986207.1 FAD-binding oxidoreductase [Rhodoplanes sp. TEM]MDQ0355634.1 D-amino-acid dehydrogenase [Rhodoplanes tepidamans]
MTDVIVLGAGIAGVAAALHLQRRGRAVALVDRQAPGRETSYGNAGIIQSEAVEPYPMPRDLASLLGVALGRGNDVRYALGALPGHAGPLLRYWWHSAPARHRRLAVAWAGLIARATAEHQDLMTAAGVPDDLVRRGGFHDMHRSEKKLDAETVRAERLHATYGVKFRRLTPTELLAAEPGLRQAGVGAIHWCDAWAVRDPGALVEAYANLFARSGGTVVHGDADTLETRPGGGFRVRTADGPLEAAAVVVALGPWSPALLRRFGAAIPMLRKRGYHRHYRVWRGLDRPLRDAAFGYVAAPMAAGLRLTTGAEFSGIEAPATPVQLGRAEQAARDLVDLGPPVENAPWLGTRPCLPDMLPLIGEAPGHAGLWLHFGHGHQGFTLGPATGRLLAEMMTGETPVVDPAPFRPERWWR